MNAILFALVATVSANFGRHGPFSGRHHDNDFFVSKNTFNNVQQCSNNRNVKLVDANVALNLLAAGNSNNKDVCQANNQIFSYN